MHSERYNVTDDDTLGTMLNNWPKGSFPEAEARFLEDQYQSANIILEYGSGGSTVMASRMTNKLVYSVESDRNWSLKLQGVIDRESPPSPAIIHHTDIGPTGDWGRPINTEKWGLFHRYPLEIWKKSFFRHPDIVLIDGRFRLACIATVGLLCKQPVRILFDDYTERKTYHDIEIYLKKSFSVGRMAVFDVSPGMIGLDEFSAVMGFFSRATYHGEIVNYNI